MSKPDREMVSPDVAATGIEARLADMLTTLASAPSSAIDKAVLATQRDLCLLLGTERSSIWQGSPSAPRTLYLTHEYALTEAPRAPAGLTANEAFPWMVAQLLDGKTVVIPDVSAMPEEAALDRDSLTRFSAKSSLVIPFADPASDVRGVVTFAALTERREWSDALISHCRLTAQVMMSVLARKRAEETAQEDRARLRAVLDSASTDLIWCVDAREFRLEVWNRAYAEYLHKVTGRVAQFGDSPAQRYQARTEMLDPWRKMYERAIKEGPYSTEFKFAPGDRVLQLELNPVLRDGVCVSISVFARDATTRVESQKMEALGRLASGVAHDFNNLLQVICSSTDMVIAELGEENRNTVRLHEVVRAGERAAELTGQLLAFSRRELRSPRVVDLVAVVRDTETLLRRVLRADIELVLNLGEKPLPTLGDPGQLHQVLINLVVNARDAMPQGGQIRIELSERELDASSATIFAALAPGRYIELSVHDTGQGIAPENLAHIFDPFFTTKERGSGTGLGLATVLGIVKQSGGDVRVDSLVTAGTRVVVLLPHANAPITSELQSAIAEAPQGGETILVAEDHPQVREVLVLMLESCGYKVLAASSGEDALALANAHRGRFELLITDIMMPRMSGDQLAKALRQTQPGLAVLFSSGFSEVPAAELDALASGPLLRKPYTRTAVANAVRAALELERGKHSAS